MKKTHTLEGINPKKNRKQNLSNIREAIYKFGPIARNDISKMLGLTQPAISICVSPMIEDGFVREVVQENGAEMERQLGRKPVLLDFDPDAFYVVGVELMPFMTTICVDNVRNEIQRKKLIDEAPPEDYEAMIDMVCEEIHEQMEGLPPCPHGVLGVGVALPGFIEEGDGIIRSCVWPDWNKRHLAKDLSQRLGLPVCIGNNVRLRAARVEMTATSTENFAYFFISHGVSCPMILRRNVLTGQTAGAGEIGHMVMDIHGPVCPTCGNQGCLNALASHDSIRAQARVLLREGKSEILAKICSEPGKLTMDNVLLAQQRGCPAVADIIRRAVYYLGVALANIINFISPEAVLVDGKIMTLPQNREWFLECARKHMYGLNSGEVRIDFHQQSKFDGTTGAASFAIRRFFLEGQ